MGVNHRSSDMAKAKKKTSRKKKVPSAASRQKVAGDAVRKAMRNAMAAVKKTEEAKAQAELKVFAAKLIVNIAKEAGIKGPPWSVKKKIIAQAKKKASDARKSAEKKVAAARKQALASQQSARKLTGA
jgi:hypothetical protein